MVLALGKLLILWWNQEMQHDNSYEQIVMPGQTKKGYKKEIQLGWDLKSEYELLKTVLCVFLEEQCAKTRRQERIREV